MATGNYIRVGGRQYPTCPICGHDSWCSVQPPGYVNVRTGEVDEFGSVICMRQSTTSADPNYRIARSIAHSKGLGGLAFKWVPVASDAKMTEAERQRLRDAAAKHAAKRASELARQVANEETVSGMIWGKAKDYSRQATVHPSQSNGLVRIAEYLTARGIPMKPEQVPLALAFYPDVQDGYDRVWPAMVAKVVTPREAHNARNDGLKLPRVQHERPEAFLGVHLTYLSRDGQPKKRPAEQGVARKKRGKVVGGAIRLYEDVLEHERAKARGGDMIWLVGEGIETTIAARTALASVGTQVDAWSVMDAGGLASVQLPEQLFGPVLVSNEAIAVARIKRHEESSEKRERLEAAGIAGASTLADCDIGPLWPEPDNSFWSHVGLNNSSYVDGWLVDGDDRKQFEYVFAVENTETDLAYGGFHIYTPLEDLTISLAANEGNGYVYDHVYGELELSPLVGQSTASVTVHRFDLVLFTPYGAAVRQFPREDGLGLSSAPRLYPPSKAQRTVGGYQ